MQFIDQLDPRQLFTAAAAAPVYSPHGWAPFETDSAVDLKGRTVLAAVYRTHGQVSVTRLNADGSTDTTFGTRGFTTLALGDAPAKYRTNAFDLIVDHAGKLLVLQNKQLSRLTATGAIDKAFGKSGTLTMPVVSKAADVTVDAKNRPIVVGTSKGKAGDRATILRLGTRGALDTSFGTRGAYETPVATDPLLKSPGNATGVAVKIYADGTIVGLSIAVSQANYGGGDTRDVDAIDAFRLRSDGSLDPSYGTKGITEVQTASNEYPTYYVYFRQFNSDNGLTIATAATDYNDVTLTTLTRLDVNGHVGKVSKG